MIFFVVAIGAIQLIVIRFYDGYVLVKFVAAVLHDVSLVLLAQVFFQRYWLRASLRIGPHHISISAGMVADSTFITDLFCKFSSFLLLPHSSIALLCDLPPFDVIFYLLEFHRLIISPVELLLSSELVSDCLVDPGIAGGSFDVDGVETAHVGLV